MSTENRRRVLVVGFGVAGRAVTKHLADSCDLVVWEDHPTARMVEEAQCLGAELLDGEAGSGDARAVVGGCDLVVTSPGVAERHPALVEARAAGVPVYSDLDLVEDPRLFVAVTGTDGKSTVVTLVTDMLRRSGLRVQAAGNIGVPLVAAVRDKETEVFVVEVSSFQLSRTTRFRADIAAWLNFAPDHLDWHETVDAYEEAKARIWAEPAPPGAVAVANAEDPVVMARLPARRKVVTFGVGRGDYRIVGGSLVGPEGKLCDVSSMPRRAPHDLANAAAASAVALLAGADKDAVSESLSHFDGLPHRVKTVSVVGGVRWVDDSKATTPHATVAAVRSFDSVILLAGGRNKGLDFSELSGVADRLRHVVAFGEAAPELAETFAGLVPVARVEDLREAVSTAASLAHEGDTVLLSPACASFDAYRSYEERGRHFRELVETITGRCA